LLARCRQCRTALGVYCRQCRGDLISWQSLPRECPPCCKLHREAEADGRAMPEYLLGNPAEHLAEFDALTA